MVRVCGFGRVCNPSRILVYLSGLVSGWSLGFRWVPCSVSQIACYEPPPQVGPQRRRRGERWKAPCCARPTTRCSRPSVSSSAPRSSNLTALPSSPPKGTTTPPPRTWREIRDRSLRLAAVFRDVVSLFSQAVGAWSGRFIRPLFT
jgi:hypothetical protein